MDEDDNRRLAPHQRGDPRGEEEGSEVKIPKAVKYLPKNHPIFKTSFGRVTMLRQLTMQKNGHFKCGPLLVPKGASK